MFQILKQKDFKTLKYCELPTVQNTISYTGVLTVTWPRVPFQRFMFPSKWY